MAGRNYFHFRGLPAFRMEIADSEAFTRNPDQVVVRYDSSIGPVVEQQAVAAICIVKVGAMEDPTHRAQPIAGVKIAHSVETHEPGNHPMTSHFRSAKQTA